MKRNIDILFLIEHVDRELQSVSFIASQLKKKYDFSYNIFSIYFHLHKILIIKPKLIVIPYAISDKIWPLNFLKKFTKHGTVFLSFNWEQYLSSANLKFKKPNGIFVTKFLNHLVWHDAYELFLQDNHIKNKNIFRVQNPALYLLQKMIMLIFLIN